MEHGRSPGDRRSSQDGVQTGVLPGVLAPLLTIAPPPCRPFRQWYEAHYGVSVGRKKKKVEEGAEPEAPKKQSKSVLAKISKRQETRVIDANINSQFDTGRLLACVSSRPGQCGRVDGYVLEGKELEFYVKKMAQKKK